MEDKFKEKRENLIENFLTRIKEVINFDYFGLTIFSAWAAMGLTLNNQKRKSIKTKIVDIHPVKQPFNEFKKDIINSLRKYLKTQIK